MSAPLATLIHGNLTLEQGCDVASFGSGDLTVANNAYITGTANSTDSGTGALVITNGGLGVFQDTNMRGTLTVSSTSNLQTTFVDTTLGPFSVSGGNAVTIAVGSSSTFLVTGGNLTLNASGGSAILESNLNSNNAVQIIAQNAVGGVNVLAGQDGQIQLTAGSGGIQGLTSGGSINLTANNATASFVVNSSAASQNLTVAVNGTTDSKLVLQSAGTNPTQAILIQSTNIAGGIQISNSNNGLGTGTITTLAGSGGYQLATNTGGSINLTASAAASSFVVNTTAANQNLTIGVNNPTASQLILQSAGTNATNAILIQNTNTAGSIQLTNGAQSTGQIRLDTGSSGLSAVTQPGGGINLAANGASSSFINYTSAGNQNLTVCVQGGTASKLILCSDGTGNQAITLSSTGVQGGIYATASGPVNINTSDSTNGINIGTLQNAPVRIGTSTSTTTINGNLDVRGVTTTVESTVVQITDNLIQVNNGPTGTADGGVAIKRYQSANDVACNSYAGDVVADVADNYRGNNVWSTAQGGSTTTIVLDALDVQADGYYNGWWIRILDGTGACQTRRIKNYTHSDNTAYIYTTADQIDPLVLNNPTPVEGLDFSTSPDSTSVYGLYPCEWIISMWDSVHNEYALVCSPMVNTSPTPPIAHYVNLHINNLTANALSVNTINGTTADSEIFVTLQDNSTNPISMVDFHYTYGIFFILVRPTNNVANRTFAIFAMGRLNSNVCGQVIRLIGVKGTSLENLDIQWPANDYPNLLYRPAPGVSGTTQYTIKIITV
jgi:hypothetical protein